MKKNNYFFPCICWTQN